MDKRTRTAGAGQGSPCWLVGIPSDRVCSSVHLSQKGQMCPVVLESECSVDVSCPWLLFSPLKGIQDSDAAVWHMSLQARVVSSSGATGAGARVSLWPSWGPRPTPALPEMPPQTQLSVVLLQTKFKTHQPPRPQNIPDASQRGSLAVIAMSQEPHLISICCCFLPSSRFSLFAACQSQCGMKTWSCRKRGWFGLKASTIM